MDTSITGNGDEWAEAFMDHAKLMIEGFKTEVIQGRLDAAEVLYDKKDGTIALLEKLLGKAEAARDVDKLVGLRTVQLLRSKVMLSVATHSSWRRTL